MQGTACGFIHDMTHSFTILHQNHVAVSQTKIPPLTLFDVEYKVTKVVHGGNAGAVKSEKG